MPIENSTTKPDTDTKVACLGAGLLGRAIMQRLLACGFDITVWNRSPEKLDEVVAAGAKRAATPAGAVAGQFMLVAEACGLAEHAGVDPAQIPHALAGGRADSAILQEYMTKMARSDFFVSGTIGQIVKDLEMIRSLARNTGASMPITALLSEFYHKLMSQHSGEVDTAEVIRLYR